MSDTTPAAAQPPETQVNSIADQGVVNNQTFEHDDVVKAQEQANATGPKPYKIMQDVRGEDGTVTQQEILVRDIVLRIPVEVSDATVNAAWQTGMAAVINAKNGVMSIVFPHARANEQGQMIPTLGRKDCLLAKPEDVERILKLADVISRVNLDTAQVMATNPGNAIEAAKRGTIAKDNAVSELSAQADGRPGGIVIATR